MELLEPHQYPRRILVVVIGMSPQIVTETLYKLAVSQEPAFVPDEVHIITTLEGADSAKLALLGVKYEGGWFNTFCDDFNFNSISFNESHIHVIGDTEGQFINDAESSRHNRMAADFITETIRNFASDENTALHVSLAGGRKTMSYYAGYALSLYGRLQDRLSHVLVNPPFINNPDFYYPRPEAQRLLIEGKYYSTDEARIVLSDIPYVRMRYQLPNELLVGDVSFHEAVDVIQKFTQAESMELNVQERKVILNGKMKLNLGPIDTALLHWFCDRALNGEKPLILDEDAFMPDFLVYYAQAVGKNSGHYDNVKDISDEGDIQPQKEWFWRRNSKLAKHFKTVLGEKLARPFLIDSTDCNGRSGYLLRLKPEQIKIIK